MEKNIYFITYKRTGYTSEGKMVVSEMTCVATGFNGLEKKLYELGNTVICVKDFEGNKIFC